MSVICPISGDANVKILEELNSKTLISLYKKVFNIDVSQDFYGVDKIGIYQSTESNLIFFYPPIAGGEGFYEQLQKFDWYYMDEKPEYNFANQFIKKSDLILEIGCGKGAFSKKVASANYVGLEFSRKAKELAEHQGTVVLNESIQQHSLENADKYDVVCAFQVLEHIPEINSFIEGCIRATKPGGLLIYSVPSADSFLSLISNNLLNMPPHHVSFWSDKSLRYLGKKFYLNLVSIQHEKLSTFHKEWWNSSLVINSVKAALNQETKWLDNSIQYKFLQKISGIAGKFLAKGMDDEKGLPDGHSVTAIYQK
ncbi:class I SAM-dependent methyltransferase [Laspinema sp. D1]|uniref:Class I SAM-dependent methyltransferase n=1 Tax=Laspinema palackyanum D2a TaxID=2953684 RepID=A0ABT2MMI0_9CYAN|nr:class I SAM-dependent methyltransferase [Laspinema sp. D2a]